jgi:hypothetical protein
LNIGLDSSVILRLVTREPEPQASFVAFRVSEALRSGDRLEVSDLVLAEAYFALQHHYSASKSQALADLRDFLDLSGVSCRASTRSILHLPQLDTKKPGFVDRLIHAGYLESNDRLWTCERAAARLPSVELLS